MEKLVIGILAHVDAGKTLSLIHIQMCIRDRDSADADKTADAEGTKTEYPLTIIQFQVCFVFSFFFLSAHDITIKNRHGMILDVYKRQLMIHTPQLTDFSR